MGNDHRPFYILGSPGKVIYISFGALFGAIVVAPFICGFTLYCVLAFCVLGGGLGWLGWRSADDYKNERARLASERPSRAIDVSCVPETGVSAASQTISFPGWIKVTIYGSIVVLILAFFVSFLYYIGIKLLLIPAFFLLLAGLALFTVGISAAGHYDKQGQ